MTPVAALVTLIVLAACIQHSQSPKVKDTHRER